MSQKRFAEKYINLSVLSTHSKLSEYPMYESTFIILVLFISMVFCCILFLEFISSFSVSCISMVAYLRKFLLGHLILSNLGFLVLHFFRIIAMPAIIAMIIKNMREYGHEKVLPVEEMKRLNP